MSGTSTPNTNNNEQAGEVSIRHKTPNIKATTFG
jgi:hypothetical protein